MLGLAHSYGSFVRTCAHRAGPPSGDLVEWSPEPHTAFYVWVLLSHQPVLLSSAASAALEMDSIYFQKKKVSGYRCLPLPHPEPLVSLDHVSHRYVLQYGDSMLSSVCPCH